MKLIFNEENMRKAKSTTKFMISDDEFSVNDEANEEIQNVRKGDELWVINSVQCSDGFVFCYIPNVGYATELHPKFVSE
ncbi:hypothetical protein NVP1113A_49 [Vibrio phage 1.113.A._10N.286.51.E7]|nr:hypothetical protein NVP1113A_49 [Vibrio phage 1.113.A._10N.286.51.E7]